MTRGLRRPTARRRRAFTLIEVMIALTLTAIAATMAGTAVSAARRTAAVVQTHRTTDEAELRLRALLADMLRHPPAAAMADAPLLTLSGAGNEATLEFLSRGVTAPYGTGPIWQVTVRREADTLRVTAEPLGATGIAPLRMGIGGVTGFTVRALEASTSVEAGRWRADWPLAQVRPVALALQWSHGPLAAAPFVVSLDPLQGASP